MSQIENWPDPRTEWLAWEKRLIAKEKKEMKKRVPKVFFFFVTRRGA